ncbi:MAG: SMC-Scp complex subunit ScpB [Thermoanaerobaculia bacterium]
MTDRLEMEAVAEAILFVANQPLSRDKLLEVFAEKEREEAAAALEAVIARYRDEATRGVVIDEAAGGLRLVSRPDLHGYLRRFFEVTGTNKLTMAALETLAIVAYRQPITGPEIHELRGVNSSGVLKTLLERRQIRIAGRREVVGKPFLYATTREFLMRFGLRSLKELPPLEQFDELLAADDGGAVGSPPDQEEEILRRTAALDEEESAAAEQAEAESIVEERAAAEEADEAGEAVDVEAEGEIGEVAETGEDGGDSETEAAVSEDAVSENAVPVAENEGEPSP